MTDLHHRPAGFVVSAAGSVLATAKHYVGDGGTTGGVDQGNTQLTEAELRAIHLPPFQRRCSAASARS
jgi:beta-glucosidase